MIIRKELQEVCEIDMGQAPPGNSYNENEEGYPLIAGASDFGDWFPVAFRYTSSPTKISKNGDIILCIRATIGDLNWSDKNYCLGRGVAGLRPYKNALEPNYLWWWLYSNKDQLTKLGKGSTYKQISRQDIESFLIPIQPISEQKRIAAILDKADAIRRKRRQAIQLADEFLRSVFLDMFGDPVTNPKAWPIYHLGDFLSFLTSGSRGWAKYYTSSGARFNRSLDVQMNYISDTDAVYVTPPNNQESKRTLVQPNDVLLTITGSKIGRVSDVPQSVREAYISQL